MDRIESFLTRPDVIAGELERLQRDDPTQADLSYVERGISEAGRKIGNLTRTLAMFDDQEAAAPIVAEIQALRAQQRVLEGERDAVLKRRAGWEEAQRRLSDLQHWCKRVSTRLADLTYDQKRLALEALGVEIRVWKADHEPRYIITAEVNLEELRESDRASVPGYMMRPRTRARSGCW